MTKARSEQHTTPVLRQPDPPYTALTVADLIDYLQTFPPNAALVQSMDEEGNAHSYTYEVYPCNFLPDSHTLWPFAPGSPDWPAPPPDAVFAVCFRPSH